MAGLLPLPDRPAKLIAKPGELLDLSLDGPQVLLGETEHDAAWALSVFSHMEDFPDFLERETKLFSLSDEKQPAQVPVTEDPVAGRFAAWVRKKTLALIVADGLNRNAGLLCHLSDLHMSEGTSHHAP
ncbi:MAG: hypothetical protein M1423_01810 [Acidobacteria bacterium]|nr:hypothetical protein [Acidobacteriota bacterium]